MSEISDAEIRQIVQRVVYQALGLSGQTPTPGNVPATLASANFPTQVQPSTQSVARPTDRQVVAIGADHGGFELKEVLKADLSSMSYEVIDAGTHGKEAVDYPDFAHDVARLVGTGKAWRGIVVDGAGIGSCIVANKVPGIRAGMAYDLSSAANSREHNDTNVFTLGAGLIGVTLARQIVKTWLGTIFAGGRHACRIDKIVAIEKQYLK